MRSDWKVPLADLDFDEAEERAVVEVLRRRWLTMGAVTREFEEEFAAFCGVKHAIAVSNGTVALHLACLVLGIGAGDNVIVPSLSFVATANAVLYTGAEVRFADITSLHDLTIDPRSIYKQIDSRTKAIMVMHYGGYPCDMPTILKIADEHHLPVIEDAAHAPGGWINGAHLGTLGYAGCFSFFSNKNLATGEGGMLVTNRDEISNRVRFLRSHGMTSLTWDRHHGHAHSYDVTELGFNYRIDEIRAALGREQLKKLRRNNSRREAITRQYWSAFEKYTQGNEHSLVLPFAMKHSQATNAVLRADPTTASLVDAEPIKTSLHEVEPAYHIFSLLLPVDVSRDQFIASLKEKGIQTSIHYPPIHTFLYYRNRRESARHPSPTLPVTEEAAHREVTLPLYPGMSTEQVKLVIDAVEAALTDIVGT